MGDMALVEVLCFTASYPIMKRPVSAPLKRVKIRLHSCYLRCS